MGIVEIHTWNCTADDLDHPNRLVWDLDPGPQVSWRKVVKAARLVRDVLNTLQRWTLLTVPQRRKHLRADPWKDYWHSAQVIRADSFPAVTDVSTK